MTAESHEGTNTIYEATKSAIPDCSSSLRKELNPLGIKVSLIEPGAVTSDMQKSSKAEQQVKIEKMEKLKKRKILQ